MHILFYEQAVFERGTKIENFLLDGSKNDYSHASFTEPSDQVNENFWIALRTEAKENDCGF